MQPEPAKLPLMTQIADFGRYVLKQAGHRVFLALGFLLLGSLTEGLSILLLVPLLALVGPESSVVSIPVPEVLAGVLGEQIRLSLLPILAALVLLVFAQALFTRFKNIYMAELLYDVINRLRIDLFESIGRARWGFIARIRGSDLSHVLTADIDRVQNAAFHLLQLVQNCVLLAVYLCISLLISPTMTAFAFLTGGLLLALLRPIRRQAARYGRLLTGNRQEQYRTVQEFLTGMKVAKSFNAEPRYLGELAATLGRMRADYSRFVRLSSIGGALSQMTTGLVLAAFVYVAIAWLVLPLPEIVVLVFLFLRVQPRFSTLQSDIQETLVNIPAFHAMKTMKDACDRERERSIAVAGQPAILLRLEIRFDDVTFRYAGDASEDVVGHASFTMPARQITALIGTSGSGKTTIADMLMGLLEPTAGTVSIDGLALDESNRRRWRDHVAYVPQDVFLLHDTIAANLRLAAPDLDEAALWKALEAAHADGFVRRLPEGLQTVVGDRGLRLSGGERQRIALARGLLRRPQMLILDEATSALDWENQALIARSIEELRGSMTILTIAHRPSMIAFADWVVALEAGRAEAGPFDRMIRAADSQLARLVAGEQADTRRARETDLTSVSVVSG